MWIDVEGAIEQVLSNSSKILIVIIRRRLKPNIEKQMSEEQAGFRPSRGKIKQIFSLRLLAEKHTELQGCECI
jgi:hypothetical protein